MTKASFCMLTKPPTFTSLLGVCSTAGCLRPPTRLRSPLGLCQVLSTLPALSLLTAVPLHKKRSHGVVPVPSIAAGISWFLLGVAFQPVAFLSYSIEHPGIDLTGTHGDSGAGLKPPPSAKLSTLPCCLRNVVPRINPYSSPSTTLTGILLTRSSGMNTNVMSHDLTVHGGNSTLDRIRRPKQTFTLGAYYTPPPLCVSLYSANERLRNVVFHPFVYLP